ncbi:putative acetyltransferase, GNAT [Bacillus pseudomycoides]|nr:putative acetyltransferase, GNAT [Bacillus pseudomycoides]AJI18941.1 putative acetyltransferase, GNAT [Bacillus pseudomycoides]PEE06703.1 GNAT family acetyltransferase [Bacillus pseudomycoides]PEM65765.1 GNAT family acetyltransferase [Bacillus pseudomycoides]PHC86862.1 GNAT family acetyltransferase [Bacillus pseudomycoides]
MYTENRSVPYSQSWNLICALKEALKNLEDENKFKKIYKMYTFIEAAVTNMELQLVSQKKYASSIILTIALDKELSSKEIGDSLALQGFIIHYESNYLQQNNWIQIACLNHYKEREMKRMLDCLQMQIEQVHV